MKSSQYDTQVFTALGKFKTVRNWPDLNTCLQNILDVFQTFPDVPYVSHKLLFAKTLAQCLSPALPAGIQTKALDVYSKVFMRSGEQNISRDFYIWAPGLLQFFHAAGVAQRVIALKLFDEFFIPCVKKNEKIAPPLILSILPGLTDEGTELPTRVADALEKLKVTLGSSKFWSSMCRAALITPVTRMPFLIYALKSEASEIVSCKNNDLFVTLWTGLFNDANPLVVRSSLELFNICFGLFEKDVRVDLGYKCIVLLVNDDLSIRRRVFNWVNAFPADAAESLASAPTASVRVALERGGDVKTMVIKCLPTLLARKQFDVSVIADLIDPDVLLAASKGSFSGQLRVLKHVNPSQSAKQDALTFVLDQFEQTSEFEEICDIGSLLIETANESHTEAAQHVCEYIFTKHRENKQALRFASKLASKLNLSPDFTPLLHEPIPFGVVQNILLLSRDNLGALLVLDDNMEKCVTVCWRELASENRNINGFDVCRALVTIYHKSPSSFAIGLDNNWDSEAVKFFVSNASEVPMSLVLIAQRKDLETDEGEFDLLRLIAGHAQLLIQDIKRVMKNEDILFSQAVITSIQQLLDADPALFVSSIADATLLEFVSFLINIRGTGRIINSILVAADSSSFLSSISGKICDYILDHPKDVRAHRFLMPIAKYVDRIRDLISAVMTSPPLLSAVLSVLEQIPSSQSHFEAVELTCIQTIELLAKTTLVEPLIHDVSSLFKLIARRTEAEIAECRASAKSSTFRRLLTTSELNADDCVASLTVNYIPDYTAMYSSLAPMYLPTILRAIWDGSSEDTASRFFMPLFASFESIWQLLIYYSMAVCDGLQHNLIVSCLMPLTPEEQILQNIKNIILVLSYDDKVDRAIFIRLAEALVASKVPSLGTNEAVTMFASMFQQLRVPSFLVVHFICEYLKVFPSVSLNAFATPFANALMDVRSTPDELIKTASYICGVDPGVVSLLFAQKSNLIKVLLQCDRSAIEYPKLIYTFGVIDETYNWTECIITIISDPKLFSYGREYLLQTLKAINVISRKSEKFIPQVFEFLSQKNETFWRLGAREFSGVRKIRILAFVILGCDFDFFAQKQQNINSILVHSLSLENTEIVEFKAFSLLMRVMFVRFSQKIMDSFLSILVNEITSALCSDSDLKTEAMSLLSAAMSMIPSSFQFAEFAFIPDLVSFQEVDQESDEPWPIIRDSLDGRNHLSITPADNSQYESMIINEYLSYEA